MAQEHNSQAALLLKKQLAELNKNPVEGFSAGLIDDNDIFKWEVGIIWKTSFIHYGFKDSFLFLVVLFLSKKLLKYTNLYEQAIQNIYKCILNA